MSDNSVKKIKTSNINNPKNITFNNNLNNTYNYDNTSLNSSDNIDDELINIKNQIIYKLNDNSLVDYYKNKSSITKTKILDTYNELDPVSFNEYLANKR